MAPVWAWLKEHQLLPWIGIGVGSLIAALMFSDGRAAMVAVVGTVFFVALSLAVNAVLDWWDSRRATGD